VHAAPFIRMAILFLNKWLSRLVHRLGPGRRFMRRYLIVAARRV